MRDHGKLTVLGTTAMDVAVAPAHRTGRRTEECARGVKDCFAEGQASRHIADQRRKDISFTQSDTDGNTQRLLPASEEYAAHDFPRAIQAGELVVEGPSQKHEAIRFDVQITRG